MFNALNCWYLLNHPLTIYLSIYLSNYFSTIRSIYLTINLAMNLFIYVFLTFTSIHLFSCSIHPLIYLSFHRSTYSSIYIFIYSFILMIISSIHISIYSSIISIHLFVYLSIHLLRSSSARPLSCWKDSPPWPPQQSVFQGKKTIWPNPMAYTGIFWGGRLSSHHLMGLKISLIQFGGGVWAPIVPSPLCTSLAD